MMMIVKILIVIMRMMRMMMIKRMLMIMMIMIMRMIKRMMMMIINQSPRGIKWSPVPLPCSTVSFIVFFIVTSMVAGQRPR